MKRLDAAIMYALGGARLDEVEAFKPLVRQKVEALVEQGLLSRPDYDSEVNLPVLGLPSLPALVSASIFKTTPMPRALIGISGDVGSGKDSIAQVLVESCDFERFAFGDDIKFASAALYDIPLCLLVDPETKNGFHPNAGNTLRNLMRFVGSEIFRAIDPNIWITGLETKIRTCEASNVVLSDLRTKTELDFLTQYHGKHWKAIRPDNPYSANMSTHSTDIELADEPVDCVVLNNGSLTDLKTQVENSIEAVSSIQCKVCISGEPSDEDDKNVPGNYAVEVFLDAPVLSFDALSDLDRSSIAGVALDVLHDHIGIDVLDDFEIGVFLPDGTAIHEDYDKSELALYGDFLGECDSDPVRSPRPGR